MSDKLCTTGGCNNRPVYCEDCYDSMLQTAGEEPAMALATRDRLIEQLGEALKEAVEELDASSEDMTGERYNDTRINAALAAYRDWKEGQSEHQG